MSRLCKNKGKKALFIWAKRRKLKSNRAKKQERHLPKHWPPVMSHKQKCIAFAQERLQALDLSAIWCGNLFTSYYRKHNGPQANAFFFGLDVADYIIREASRSHSRAAAVNG